MLQKLAFVFLGIFIILLLAGFLALTGFLRVGNAVNLPPQPADNQITPGTGYIRNIQVTDKRVSLVIDPITATEEMNRSCQTAGTLSYRICPVSANVEIVLRPLNKVLDYSTLTNFNRTFIAGYNGVAFEFVFAAGEIAQITEQ